MTFKKYPQLKILPPKNTPSPPVHVLRESHPVIDASSCDMPSVP